MVSTLSFEASHFPSVVSFISINDNNDNPYFSFNKLDKRNIRIKTLFKINWIS